MHEDMHEDAPDFTQSRYMRAVYCNAINRDGSVMKNLAIMFAAAALLNSNRRSY